MPDPIANSALKRNDSRTKTIRWSDLWSIWDTGLAEGLHRRLVRFVERRFPFESAKGEFAESVVAEAFDGVLEAHSRGQTIRNPSAWLFKVAKRIAVRRIQEAESLQDDPDAVVASLHGEIANDGLAAERERRGVLVEAALTHAERLLPRVGTGQVLEVMSLFLEAIRNGVDDFPPSEIAEILGISASQARTLLHRGLQRLHREAEREGIPLPSGLDPEPHDPYGPTSR